MKPLNTLKIVGAACLFIFCAFGAKAAEPAAKEATNVILFIGDGMSLAQWQTGMITHQAPLNIEKMRSIGIVKTHSATDFNGDGPTHGTAMASGIATRKGAVGLDVEGRPVKSITEYASENGLATGIVSANTLLEGSIAPFVAHVKSRMMTEEIAAAYVDGPALDVFIGGGLSAFRDRKDGRDLTAELRDKGFQVATSFDEMKNIRSGKLAGFTAEKNVPDIREGRGAQFPESVRLAISLLNQHEKGFFLLVGDMFVDRASHAGDTELVGAETIDLDKAVGEALAFAAKDGRTLVIVVGGPEASGMTLVGGNLADGKAEAKWTMPGMIHTGTMVPVFAFGPGAEAFQGIQEDTALFEKMKNALLERPKTFAE